jgi:hypothetical protein
MPTELSSSQAGSFVKCACLQCKGHFEIPREYLGFEHECPHCYELTKIVERAGETAAVAPPVAKATSEEAPFFQEGGIIVTKTRFIIGAQTFTMANITSVKGVEISANRWPPSVLLLIGAAICATNFFIGIPMAAAGLLWLIRQEPTFAVVLTTAGGEVKACSSDDSADMRRVIDALNEAIVARG